MEPYAILLFLRKAIKMTKTTKAVTFYIPRKHRQQALGYSEEITFFYLYSMQIFHKTIPKSDI